METQTSINNKDKSYKRKPGALKTPFKTMFVICFIFISFFCGIKRLAADNLNALRASIGPKDAVLVTNPRGDVKFSKNANIRLVPASILKILTSLVAIHYLSPDYRFKTSLYVDKNSNLKVKGYGDPLLTSESIAEIAARLKGKLNNINDIILDDTYFSYPIKVHGVESSPNPYDASNGALGVNFNTVFFKRGPNGKIVSAEKQTPLLPIVLGKIKKLGFSRGRIVFSHEGKENTLYTGHMLKYFLVNAGIRCLGKVKTGIVNESDNLILNYESSLSLKGVIANLLKYSNNYIANQLLLASGATAFDPPGTIEKGVTAALKYAREILAIQDVSLVEGSGISKKNKISAKDMDIILKAFEPYRHLMRRKDVQFFKTGTLAGVKTRAGFIEDKKGEFFRFVVLVNTHRKSTDKIMRNIIRRVIPIRDVDEITSTSTRPGFRSY